MFCCFPFGLSNNKKRKNTSSGEKKRRKDRPSEKTLHGEGIPVFAEVREKRKSKGTSSQGRGKETATPRSSRHEREAHRERPEYQYYSTYKSREDYRPALNLEVPGMWYRSVDPESSNSSQEMLLNPRPSRSTHQRQRHPKRTSQTTLRGRGAKRDPPKHSKSKKNLRYESSRQGWSFFNSSPPKTPRQDRHYQTFDSSPSSHRSARHYQSAQQYQQIPESSQSQQRHHRSRQHARQPPPTRSSRLRTPNTAVHRTPDRRFAVLAATNQALEDVRREAFAHPSPPPRRERTQRYQGVLVPTSSVPFNWDCVSSSQTSAGYSESGSRHRRSSRR